MADNVGITPGTGATAAADEIDGVLHQRVKITVGSDGVSRGDVDVTNPMPVRQDDLGSIEQAAEQLNTAQIPTGNDEPLQLVGLHPNFPLPIDTATPMPIAGRDSTGAQRQILTDPSGAIVQSFDTRYIRLDALIPTSVPNCLFGLIDCSGYQSIVAVCLSGSSSLNWGMQWSMDLVNWYNARVINIAGGTGQQISGYNIASVLNDTYHVPVIGRYLRFVIVANVAATQGYRWDVYLQRAPLNYPTIPSAAAVTATLSGTPTVTASGPTAAGSAHGSNNPLQISGSDGTIGRRILTDTAGNTTVVGHVAAGATLIPATSDRGPVLVGAADLERRAQRMVVDGLGRLRIQNEESGTKDDGVIDALNNVVRELKLMNAKLTDLPYYLGINSVMPDDDKAFRDDPTLFNQ